jgi:hypothetical protein
LRRQLLKRRLLRRNLRPRPEGQIEAASGARLPARAAIAVLSTTVTKEEAKRRIDHEAGCRRDRDGSGP